ncbi:TniQ family protein [Ruegeria hyattellae]|uniref:TniQ family protein n=1 Tax=Ruegeria hyattellae TaxID=3233337 RepID=UPI00355C94BB
MTDCYPLSFPIKHYETATSYASRLTRYCGLYSPNDLCLDLGFRWQDFVRGDDILFGKLAEIGGASANDMKRWAIRTTGRHQFEVSGQRATKASLVRTRLRVCPRCLVEDRQASGRLGVCRRHFWHFLSVRTCATHTMPLLTIPPEKYTIHNYDFIGQVERHWPLINEASEDGAYRASSELEHYIVDRLEGVARNGFLDQMPMFIATRLCEVLGFVMLFGPASKLADATDEDLHRAGQAGFDALRAGKESLLEVLHSLRSEISTSTMRQRSDLGAFYEWLRLSSFPEEMEPIRSIVRDYIFEHYPVPDGYEILGRPCAQRTVYTVEAACKALGIERKRISRYLVGDGAAERNKTAEGISLKRAIDRKDVAKISEEMRGRVTSSEALEMLSIKHRTLQDLCELGLVEQEIDNLDQRPKYDRAKLQAVLNSAAGKVTGVPVGGANLLLVADVARRLRCKSAEILALILAGKLNTVSGDVSRTGLAGIKVDIDQVRYALPNWELPGITRTDASTTLRVTYQTINYLIDQGLLRAAHMRNPKSRQYITGICDGSIDAFLGEFDTLGLMARRYKRPPGPFGCHLEAKGICPLETPPGISWIFRRRGLEARLHKIGVKPPNGRAPDVNTRAKSADSANQQ